MPLFRAPLATALITALAIVLSGCATKQATFDSPDLAADALVGALKPMNEHRLKEILGPESGDLVSSGDKVADQQRAEDFLEKYNQKHEWGMDSAGGKVLIVGDDAWPFPIPVVEANGRWVFDTEAGMDEMLNRRIGQNELSTIQTCLAVVDAQREYAMMDMDGNGLHEYARKFLSDSGKKNGLYWPTNPGEPESPLGDLVAAASAEGYSHSTSGKPTPFHGYRFRILTAQGPHATGGAHDYLASGRMIGGFGVVAWPASYGSSGIMTFITNQDGVVFQKDLGDDTDSAAGAMTSFDPGDGWVRVVDAR